MTPDKRTQLLNTLETAKADYMKYGKPPTLPLSVIEECIEIIKGKP